jgi:hypothetical protein
VTGSILGLSRPLVKRHNGERQLANRQFGDAIMDIDGRNASFYPPFCRRLDPNRRSQDRQSSALPLVRRRSANRRWTLCRLPFSRETFSFYFCKVFFVSFSSTEKTQINKCNLN